MKTLIFGYILFLVAILNTVLLAFGYRDFSWALTGMTLLSVLGLPLASYMLYSHYKQQPNVVLVSEDEEIGELSHWYQYINGKEPDNHSDGFFKSCR
tara:strand:- start:84 stop:374 length:291 start_codon:yes stop_codon:yes gene_type:complete